MIHLSTFLTVLAMLAVTYATRIGGYLFLRDRTISPRLQAVMETAPGCILISVIAPHFATSNPADLAALAVTLLCATRLSMLPTVIIAIVAAGLFRHLM
ncbi:AzlD family protein [Paracoccus aminophilus]|uniref:Branched-chain amino acid transport protein n=1 Tax=Paracoccus aminophilus JCM 7686 TaxID=1367847 RepID=S5Y6J9_PARAH|nr:AzlD family protein [Paracoccus aminophilus]AGT11235.1 branched-chain amino acid transport protein [Paracoccus aminophilus JCM 7686]